MNSMQNTCVYCYILLAFLSSYSNCSHFVLLCITTSKVKQNDCSSSKKQRKSIQQNKEPLLSSPKPAYGLLLKCKKDSTSWYHRPSSRSSRPNRTFLKNAESPERGSTGATKLCGACGCWSNIMPSQMESQGNPEAFSKPAERATGAWGCPNTVCILLSGVARLMIQQLLITNLLEYPELMWVILQGVSCIPKQHLQHFHVIMLSELSCPFVLTQQSGDAW